MSQNWFISCGSYAKALNSAIGFKMIKDVRPYDIEEIISSHTKENPNTKKPASKKHLINLLGTAKQIFNYAIRNKIMDFNPALDIELPRIDEPIKRRALTDEEQQWILNTEHRAKRAVMILMYSGLRRGELVVLTWSDINLTDGTISVNKSADLINGKFIFKNSAKTKGSIRIIDIPNRLVEYLRREPREGILVCTDTQGRQHTETSWRRMWDSYLNEINFKHGEFSPFQNKPKSKFDPKGVPFVIPRFTAHWLRHTFCTLMYLAGCDILTAMKQMGHTDINTTLAIYTHLDAIHKRRSMSKLDNFLESNDEYSVDRKIS
ncbi:MAG: site-specific integrase [Oscillospiraceae bacterium]|nr:site-specific integrase [Oscillospiraceae bacterium]